MRRRFELSKQHVLVGLACLCAVAAAATTFAPRLGGTVRAAAGTVLAPFADAGMYVTATARRRIGRPEMVPAVEHAALRRRADYLLAQVDHLQKRLADQRDRFRQARAFARLFGDRPAEQIPFKLIPARVVMRQALPYGQGGALNVGGAGGAAVGAPVTMRSLLTGEPKELLPERWGVVRGTVLVGRISASWAFGARVALVTDPSCKVQAQVRRVIRDPDNPRQVRIVREGFARTVKLSPDYNDPIDVIATGGDDARSVVIRQVKADHNILPGDVVVTRADGVCPERLLIGEVAEVVADAEHSGFVWLRVDPAAELDALRRVYVVKPVWTKASR
ncbi:MAG: hypothetical protein KGY99_01485 [Phycisphaerae bacterium]|nr:hypothetical protein [Phycisphaerae bacterium]